MKSLLLSISTFAGLASAIFNPPNPSCPPHVTVEPPNQCLGFCDTWVEPVTVGKVNPKNVTTKVAWTVTTVPTQTVSTVVVISYTKPRVGAACRKTIESPIQLTVWATSTQTSYAVSTSYVTDTSIVTGAPEPSCTRNQRLGDTPPGVTIQAPRSTSQAATDRRPQEATPNKDHFANVEEEEAWEANIRAAMDEVSDEI